VHCEEYELWLSAYLDGELSARDVPLLEGHLAGCDRCARELASFRTGVHLTRALAPEEPPADLRRRIMAAIDATQPSLWSRLAMLLRAPALRPALGLSAVGATAALVGIVALHRPSVPNAPILAQGPLRPKSSLTAPSASPTPQHPTSRLAQAMKTLVQHVAPKPSQETPSPSVERAEPGLPPPAAPGQLAARPVPPVDEELTGAPTEPRAAARPHRASVRRSRPVNGTSRTAASPRVRLTRSDKSPHGMTPAPPTPNDPYGTGGTPDSASGEVVSSASANVTPDPGSDDAVTMMASMPMMPSGAELEPTPAGNDELAALRQRLAVQRRELPSISLGTVHRSRRATQPAIEF
jgi:hypothetical protein